MNLTVLLHLACLESIRLNGRVVRLPRTILRGSMQVEQGLSALSLRLWSFAEREHFLRFKAALVIQTAAEF